jgi:hypothetical protein
VGGSGKWVFIDEGAEVFNVVLDDLDLLVEVWRSPVAVGSLRDQLLVELQPPLLLPRSHYHSLSGWGVG